VTINGRDIIAKFKRDHARSRKSLDAWVVTVAAATWSNAEEMKKTFNSVDVVGSQVIFDIGGNNYRMFAVVEYGPGVVEVKEILTHAEYDKKNKKK